jgi:hypothetical protein
MAIFNSYVTNYQRVIRLWISHCADGRFEGWRVHIWGHWDENLHVGNAVPQSQIMWREENRWTGRDQVVKSLCCGPFFTLNVIFQTLVGTSPVKKKICAGSEPPKNWIGSSKAADSIGMKQRNFQAAHRRTAVWKLFQEVVMQRKHLQTHLVA